METMNLWLIKSLYRFSGSEGILLAYRHTPEQQVFPHFHNEEAAKSRQRDIWVDNAYVTERKTWGKKVEGIWSEKESHEIKGGGEQLKK